MLTKALAFTDLFLAAGVLGQCQEGWKEGKEAWSKTRFQSLETRTHVYVHFLLLIVSCLVFPKHISSPVGCLRNGGACEVACRGHLKQMGTCGTRRPKCCPTK
uniref:Beta-defensin-like domain-containing protein n=1 Tax=Sciurus vulgaris TaxID=55149 RepID=A0A8D2B2T1_SCIVU